MIFHLILNSLLVFLILALLVETFLFLFKINNARVRYICRLLPVLKLPFDFLVFSLYGDSLFVNLNPFSCEIYLKEFKETILHIDPSISLPQHVASYFKPIFLKLFGLSVGVTSAFFIVKKFMRIVSSRRYMKKALASSTPCDRVISNKIIQDKINRLHVVILLSPEVQSPLAAGNRSILFPKDLVDELSQEEFEAVIAHELEHLRWKDPVIRFVSNIVCSLFWWIPTAWWIKRMEADQELASDLGTPRYGIDPCALGSAFVKAIRQTRIGKGKSAAICPFVSAKNTHAERLENILTLPRKPKGNHFKTALATAACSTAFLCFWMC